MNAITKEQREALLGHPIDREFGRRLIQQVNDLEAKLERLLPLAEQMEQELLALRAERANLLAEPKHAVV